MPPAITGEAPLAAQSLNIFPCELWGFVNSQFPGCSTSLKSFSLYMQVTYSANSKEFHTQRNASFSPALTSTPSTRRDHQLLCHPLIPTHPTRADPTFPRVSEPPTPGCSVSARSSLIGFAQFLVVYQGRLSAILSTVSCLEEEVCYIFLTF